MHQSHESYGACGLGSDATDKLVRLLLPWEHDAAVCKSAKITGGGRGACAH